MFIQRVSVFVFFYLLLFPCATEGVFSAANIAKTRRTQSLHQIRSRPSSSSAAVFQQHNKAVMDFSTGSELSLTEHKASEPIASTSGVKQEHIESGFKAMDLEPLIENIRQEHFENSPNLINPFVESQNVPNIVPSRDGVFARVQKYLQISGVAIVSSALTGGGIIFAQNLHNNTNQTAKSTTTTNVRSVVTTNTNTIHDSINHINNPLG